MQFTITDTMTKGLSLSGAELLVYAYIGSDSYTGTNVTEWYDVCGAGKLSTVRRALKSLEEKGLIEGVRDNVTSPMVYCLINSEGDNDKLFDKGHFNPMKLIKKEHKGVYRQKENEDW